MNYSYFMRLVGGVDRFKEIMTWLPTWEDLRTLLRQLDVSDRKVTDYLQAVQAIKKGEERMALLQLVQSVQTNPISPYTTSNENERP